MKVLQLLKAHQFTTQTQPVPKIEENQALICFKYGLLCGSDYPKYVDESLECSTPLPPGMPLHECVGQVVESRIPNLLPKTWVLAMPDHNRGLAEFFVVSRQRLTPLIGWTSNDLPFAALAQPTGAVLYALDSLGHLANQTVLIFGLGGIGLIFCALLSLIGVKQIIGVEPNDFRRKMASKLYKVKTFARCSNELNNVADISIDAVGQCEQSKIIAACLDSTRPHGTIILFGVPTVAEQKLSVYSIIRKNMTLIGTISPDWIYYLPSGVQTVKDNLDLFKPLITHRFHWEQAPQAFELFEKPAEKRVKILLHD